MLWGRAPGSAPWLSDPAVLVWECLSDCSELDGDFKEDMALAIGCAAACSWAEVALAAP